MPKRPTDPTPDLFGSTPATPRPATTPPQPPSAAMQRLNLMGDAWRYGAALGQTSEQTQAMARRWLARPAEALSAADIDTTLNRLWDERYAAVAHEECREHWLRYGRAGFAHAIDRGRCPICGTPLLCDGIRRKHRPVELSVAECRARGIDHFGMNWHVYACSVCGHVAAEDSGD